MTDNKFDLFFPISSQIQSPYKILGTVWKSAGIMTAPFTICVVAIETRGGWKAYMSPVPDIDPDDGAQWAARGGAKLMKEEARGFFPQFINLEYIY